MNFKLVFDIIDLWPESLPMKKLNNTIFYKCKELNIPTIKSYIDINLFIDDLKRNAINFPVFVKPYNGSCSMNIQKVDNIEDLKFYFSKYDNLIIQEYMEGIKYVIGVYVDMIS